MTVCFQIFKLQLLSYLQVDFDQTCIKILVFESSVLTNILSILRFPLIIYQYYPAFKAFCLFIKIQ